MHRPTNYNTRGSWYSIQNKAQGPTQVFIYDEIGMFGISADSFVNDLRNIKGDIDLHLSSGGGNVFDGVVIYNQLKQHQGNVTVTVDGIAASIASVIAMAGDQVLMAPGATMMIHEAHGAMEGNSATVAKFSDTLNKMSDTIAGFYERKTGTPAATWRDAMQKETWYNAQEAVDAKLADGIVGQPNIRNSVEPAQVQAVQKPHGDVEYADPGYLDADGEQVSKSGKEGVARYPIDESHVQAAWSYINQEKNAEQYTPEQLSEIKSKIKAAMKKFGHEVTDYELITKIVNSQREVFNL